MKLQLTTAQKRAILRSINTDINAEMSVETAIRRQGRKYGISFLQVVAIIQEVQ